MSAQGPCVENVPQEVLCYTFSFLDPPTLAAAATVSKRWANTAMDNVTWKNLYSRKSFPLACSKGNNQTHWGNSSMDQDNMETTPDWRKLYRVAALTQKNWDTFSCRTTVHNPHFCTISSMQVDQLKVVSGSFNKEVVLSNWKTGDVLYRTTLDSRVSCVKFCNSTLLVGQCDGNTHVFTLAADDKIVSCGQVLPNSFAWVEAIAMDASSAIVGYSTGEVWEWDIETNKKVGAFAGHRQNVLSVHCDHSTIISGGTEDVVHVWDRRARKVQASLVHKRRTKSLQYDAETQTLLCGTASDIVNWDMRTSTKARVIERAHPYGVLSLRCQNGRVVSGGRDSFARVWSLETGKCIKEWGKHGDWVGNIHVDPGHVLYASDQVVCHNFTPTCLSSVST